MDKLLLLIDDLLDELQLSAPLFIASWFSALDADQVAGVRHHGACVIDRDGCMVARARGPPQPPPRGAAITGGEALAPVSVFCHLVSLILQQEGGAAHVG